MATNTYTYGSLGQRWTVGETTSKARLDISRNSADANRWTLTQLLTDPDNTANFAHGIKAVYTSAESTPTNVHNFINYTGASEIPCVALSTTAGGSTTLNGYLTSTSLSNTILWNSRRSTGFYLASDDKIKFYVSSAFKEIPHQGNAIITTGMIDASTLITSGESFGNSDSTIPTSASVKAYADSAGSSISFSGSTGSGLLTYSSATQINVASDLTYNTSVLALTGSTTGALRVTSTHDSKVYLGGSNDPLVYWMEGSTNKVSESWDSTNHYFKIAQLQDSTDLRIGAGASGLQWTYVEGLSPATKTVWHSGNSFTYGSSTFSFTGGITATGDIESTSDERVKTDIKTITNAIDKVTRLRGVSFKKYNKDSIGVIAQEVEKIVPEVVTVPDGEDGLASVAYGNLVGLLIEAVKEQQQQIDDLLEQVYA